MRCFFRSMACYCYCCGGVLVAGVTSAGAEEGAVGGGVTAPQEIPKPARMEIVDRELIPSVGAARPGKVLIEGLREISEEDARAMITFQVRNIEESGVTMARADDAAFFLEEGIRDFGYREAKVEWEITSANDVLLTVQEAKEVYVGEIVVRGNEHLSAGAIRELITQATRKRLGYSIGAKDIPFVEDDVRAGVEAIRHLYVLMGYAEVEVELVETIHRPETSRMDLSITVVEGLVQLVGEIDLPAPIAPQVEAVYPSLVPEFGGKPYTAAVSANLANRIMSAAQDAGYFDAEVEVDAAPPRRGPPGEDGDERLFVDLTVLPDWGERYTFAGVEVSGLEKVREGVVDRRFDPLIGEPYSPKAVNERVEMLLETGAFNGFTTEAIPQPDRTITLKVAVEEAKRHSLAPYLGYSNYEGPIIGLEYRNSNFLRRLQTLEIEGEFTGRGLSGDIEYTNPWLFDTDWQLKLGANAGTTDNEGYDVFNVGFRLGLRRDFGAEKRHRITLFAIPEYGDITDFEIEEQFLGPRDYVVSRAGVIYSYDSRDDPTNPRKGLIADFLISGAGSAIGSDVEFVRGTARAVYLQPVGRSTLRLAARAGIIDPSGDEELPIDIRFFSGGAQSVRSFRERDLGPKDRNNFPIGGEFVTVFNVEYEIPVAGPFSVAPFFDAGNLLSQAEDASLDDMHYAGGLGLILNSPIGPLRIDYGHNLNRGENEPSGSWHIGFGVAF
ncbi:MAG: BamA/TamA family outer membrane protein [Verrucomicrobiota bacterium]